MAHWVAGVGTLLSVACSVENGGEAATGGAGNEPGPGAAGSESSPVDGGASGAGGARSASGDAACDCRSDDACPDSLEAYCATRREGCPPTTDTWLTCARAGQLGATRYQLHETDTQQIIYHVFGFGDHVYWVYEDGELVGAGSNPDVIDERVACGTSWFNEYAADTQLWEMTEEAGAGGAAATSDVAPRAGASSAVVRLPECEVFLD